MRNEDQAIHNLLLSLYVQQSDDTPLLQMLKAEVRAPASDAWIRADVILTRHQLVPRKPLHPAAPTCLWLQRRFYDLQYALRLCMQHNKAQACILIYSAMGLYEEAVELALKVRACSPDGDRDASAVGR